MVCVGVEERVAWYLHRLRKAGDPWMTLSGSLRHEKMDPGVRGPQSVSLKHKNSEAGSRSGATVTSEEQEGGPSKPGGSGKC